MAYANGRRALGQCDRCGQRYLLRELHNEWNGLKHAQSVGNLNNLSLK